MVLFVFFRDCISLKERVAGIYFRLGLRICDGECSCMVVDCFRCSSTLAFEREEIVFTP